MNIETEIKNIKEAIKNLEITHKRFKQGIQVSYHYTNLNNILATLTCPHERAKIIEGICSITEYCADGEDFDSSQINTHMYS